MLFLYPKSILQERKLKQCEKKSYLQKVKRENCSKGNLQSTHIPTVNSG
nr:MAG TPA: hypothetical protein [Caudoviricetes sp.]